MDASRAATRARCARRSSRASGSTSRRPSRPSAPAGEKATLGADGLAVAPESAPQEVKDAIAAANRIVGKPYKYGGGHGRWEDSGYDCSGAMSYALHGAGLVNRARTSGDYMSWGLAGEGTWITVYAHGGHGFLVIAGLRFDTGWNNAGQGPRWSEKMRPADGYTSATRADRSYVRRTLVDRATTGQLVRARPSRAASSNEQRDQQAEDADDHQDDPDRRDLDSRDVRVDGEVEDRANGDQEE